MNTRTRLRAIVAEPGLSIWPGAYDALSAKLIERAGFDAMVAGGYAAIGSMMAEADLGQSNVRDYAAHYERICSAVDIPVYVDGDTGFGGLHNIRQMVRAFEGAGVAGLFFSDQVFPNRCGYLPGKEVVSTEQMLARVNAALDARRDTSMMIVARTDVYGIEGLDAAIERCQHFLDTGVDAAKPQGVDTLEEIRRVVAEVACPHIGTLSQAAGPPKVTLDELAAAGVTSVTLPSAALFAAAAAVGKLLDAVRRDGSLEHIGDQLMPLPEYYELVGLSEAVAREERYDVAAEATVRAHASPTAN
jgi:2-methylisocitrate lyase-like PEP mutase family enzyme